MICSSQVCKLKLILWDRGVIPRRNRPLAGAGWVASAVVCLFLSGSLTAIAEEAPSAEQIEFFESSVRPIFVEHCYECHSEGADEVEAELLLDSKWGWMTGGESGPAIIPGNLDESLVIDAVRYQEDKVTAMPPRSKLSDKDIATLEKWVKMGAPDPRAAKKSVTPPAKGFNLDQRYRDHWSWRPIAKPELPWVENREWPKSDLDRFILQKIEASGLQPAPETDRRTWLRRVYFDLIGLPPTPEQIAGFLNDDSESAYENVVNELLQSPHLGEKWARHWMDLVRYAETYGHEFDYPLRHAHEYRDYLIRAFNADVPFDQFIREHIAGDLLPEPRRNPDEGWNESIIGTGFWYLHEATHAPTDVLGNEADIMDNQIDVFGKTFLGLTIACARCHDHKFDAITTADYYALSAHLQSSCRQEYPLDPSGKRLEATRKINRLRQSAADDLKSVEQLVEKGRRSGDYYRAAMRTLSAPKSDVDPAVSLQKAAQAEQLDASRLQRWVEKHEAIKSELTDAGYDLANQNVLVDFRGDSLPEGWTTSGLAFLPTGSGLGFAANGELLAPDTVDSGIAGKKQVGILRSPTFEITTDRIHVLMKASPNAAVRVVIDNFQMAEFNALLFRGTFMNNKGTDTQGNWQWKSLAGDLRKYKGHKGYLEFIDPGDATIAIDKIVLSDGGPPGKQRADQSKFNAEALNELHDQAVLDLKSGTSNQLISALLKNQLLSVEELSPAAAASLGEAGKIAESMPNVRRVIAMAQGTPEDAQVYIRGSHQNPGEAVPARFLEALGGEPVTRLELADRVASLENPLTARVIVNRLWHHLFGVGIVPTVDDFGPQGLPPSHPELLDWLATDLVDSGWSLKHLMKEMVLSSTYRQASVANTGLSEKQLASVDPTNALLHRMRVRRLSGEAIRDAVLVASGRLQPKPFGPSVATHRTPFMTGRGARPSGPLDGNGRRSVYLSVYRNFLNPFMLTFDMPSPFGPKGRRSNSNVPAQALALMNDPFIIGQAGIIADRSLAVPDQAAEQRIALMVERVHGVVPTDQQIEQLQQFLDVQAKAYGKEDKRVWVDLAHALLNMKAFYFLQ
jgi:mono/diheme cytochrome c family protein